ncbi:hypothetical protein SAMN05444682_110144 [Parapedobacter indicus]|uniref:Uncharacterized protein n=1 Tax=Parapedobacter indicus TaxID=1477437 RepID=A0A1I3RW49_9SPHI|nr:hypothetical protein CLV26_110101 [Parapedobacter indicus]SFJ50112.1 hypothetical protein SAMN05444682_110144 [Parapedobacter indicus]
MNEILFGIRAANGVIIVFESGIIHMIITHL